MGGAFSKFVGSIIVIDCLWWFVTARYGVLAASSHHPQTIQPMIIIIIIMPGSSINIIDEGVMHHD